MYDRVHLWPLALDKSLSTVVSYDLYRVSVCLWSAHWHLQTSTLTVHIMLWKMFWLASIRRDKHKTPLWKPLLLHDCWVTSNWNTTVKKEIKSNKQVPPHSVFADSPLVQTVTGGLSGRTAPGPPSAITSDRKYEKAFTLTLIILANTLNKSSRKMLNSRA